MISSSYIAAARDVPILSPEAQIFAQNRKLETYSINGTGYREFYFALVRTARTPAEEDLYNEDDTENTLSYDVRAMFELDQP